jgi:hypothetical protein
MCADYTFRILHFVLYITHPFAERERESANNLRSGEKQNNQSFWTKLLNLISVVHKK